MSPMRPVEIVSILFLSWDSDFLLIFSTKNENEKAHRVEHVLKYKNNVITQLKNAEFLMKKLNASEELSMGTNALLHLRVTCAYLTIGASYST